MNRLIILAAALSFALCGSNFAANDPVSTPQALDPYETMTLIYMREEEKLSRDAYITFNDLWNMKVFENIQASEQRHMDAMLRMLEKFGVEDPVSSDAVGVFTDPQLASLYLDLIERGDDSRLEALLAAGFIEEMDIRDLRQAIQETDEPALINAYSNLLAGSRNHLRSFVSHVVALGGSYEAQVLDPEDLGDIVGDYEAVPGENFSINSGLNDAWYYPATNGQGFFITVYPDVGEIFLGWFTYEVERPAETATAILGEPGHRWLTAQGSYSGGQAELEIDITSGGVFDQGTPKPVHEPGGSILLQFENCLVGSVIYDIPSIGLSGFIPIERISLDNVTRCQALDQESN